MRPPNVTAPQPTGIGEGRGDDTDSGLYTDDSTIARLRSTLLRRVWVLEYSLEARRQHYAESKARLREVCVCAMLALLRLGHWLAVLLAWMRA